MLNIRAVRRHLLHNNSWGAEIQNILNYLNKTGSSYVIFRPDGDTTNSTVATTAEGVQSAINDGAIAALVDSSLGTAALPAGFNLNCLGVCELLSYNDSTDTTSGDFLTVTDTAVIQDCPKISKNLGVFCQCITSPAFNWTIKSQPKFTLNGGADIIRTSTATVPVFRVGSIVSEQSMQLVVQETSSFIDQGAPSTYAFGAASGGTLIVFASFFPFIGPRSFGSSAGGSFYYYYDSSAAPDAWTYNAGTYAAIPFDVATGMGYSPAVPSNWSGTAPTNPSAALDRLAAAFNSLTPPVKP